MYDGEKPKTLVKGIKSGYFMPNIFIPRNGVIQSTILVKRDLFDKIGGFNESSIYLLSKIMILGKSIFSIPVLLYQQPIDVL